MQHFRPNVNDTLSSNTKLREGARGFLATNHVKGGETPTCQGHVDVARGMYLFFCVLFLLLLVVVVLRVVHLVVMHHGVVFPMFIRCIALRIKLSKKWIPFFGSRTNNGLFFSFSLCTLFSS